MIRVVRFSASMAELKTKPTSASMPAFLAAIEDPAKRADAERIDGLMREASGEPGKLWGTNIVGYGECHMVYETGRELDWFWVGFSPRKANTTLYIMPGFANYGPLLAKLGKVKTGASCLYVKRLADVDEAVLTELITDSVHFMRERYGGSVEPAKPPGKKAPAKKAPAKK